MRFVSGRSTNSPSYSSQPIKNNSNGSDRRHIEPNNKRRSSHHGTKPVRPPKRRNCNPEYTPNSTSNPQSQASRPEPKTIRSSGKLIASPKMYSPMIPTHYPNLPPPFQLNSEVSDIDPCRIIEAIDELPAATQLLDAFHVLRENTRSRDRWESRVQQWRKCRPVTMEFVFELIDLPYQYRYHTSFKPSTPTNAIRAAVTYNKLRLDAFELGSLHLGVEAAKKTLDYLLLCSFQDTQSTQGIDKKIPEHEMWFSEAIRQINPLIDIPIDPLINPTTNPSNCASNNLTSYLPICSVDLLSIRLPQYPSNERSDYSQHSSSVEAGKATDQEIEEAGGRVWLASELELLMVGRKLGLAKTPSHIPLLLLELGGQLINPPN